MQLTLPGGRGSCEEEKNTQNISNNLSGLSQSSSHEDSCHQPTRLPPQIGTWLGALIEPLVPV